MIRRTDCPMCGSVEHTLIYKIFPKDFFYGYVHTTTHLGPEPPDVYLIWRCEHCGHWFVNPRLPDDQLLACYPQDRFTKSSGYHQFDSLRRGKIQKEASRHINGKWIKHWQLQAQRLISMNLPINSILDVGCADGSFLRQIPQEWHRVGIDNNLGAISLARELSGDHIKYICSDLTARDWQGMLFGAVTIFDTLEHLIDPKKLITMVSDLLPSGGILWISTPSCNSPGARYFKKNWALVTPAVHLHYFNIKSLNMVLENCGLKAEHIRVGKASLFSALAVGLTFRKRRLFLKLLLYLGPISRLLFRMLNLLDIIDHKSLFLNKLKNINAAESLRPRFDDNIEIIARKI
jgi:2-polyprenyl-3-methyl-5-hydroxy-6-metoxy-1,4-benzoquinol methylase